MEDNDRKILALHEILKEDFTEEQLRIILVSAMEEITNKNYEKIIKLLDSFYILFNKSL